MSDPVSDGKAIQKTVLLTMKSISTPEGFEVAERAVEIGCIKSSIQTKKVLLVLQSNCWSGFIKTNPR